VERIKRADLDAGPPPAAPAGNPAGQGPCAAAVDQVEQPGGRHVDDAGADQRWVLGSHACRFRVPVGA
jgi:hypothetical protein